MILEKNTVTITKEAIKKYGSAGAIVLQILYDKYGGVFELDIDKWHEDELDFISVGQISSTLTILRKKGYITVENDTVYIHDRKQRVIKEEIEEEENEPEKRENPVWEMAVTIQTVTKVNPKLVKPNRYLRLAKKLVNAEYTENFILTNYGNNGWWYREDFRGQKGQPPTQGHIENTIHLVGKTFNNNNQQTQSGSSPDSIFR